MLTWCPNHSCEVQTCIISSHEELEIKISSWRFYLILEKLDWRQSANTSNNSNLNFGHRCKRIFKCLSRFVKTCFFLSVLFCVSALILKKKTVTRCYAARQTIFLNSFSTSLFSFRQESYVYFFNKNCFAYFAYFSL